MSTSTSTYQSRQNYAAALREIAALLHVKSPADLHEELARAALAGLPRGARLANSRASNIQIETLTKGVSSATAGIWRITAQTNEGATTSMILKGVWQGPGKHDYLWGTTHGKLSEPFHWAREVLAYEARFLNEPGIAGVRTPHCYGIVADGIADHRVGILMEDVKGVAGPNMTLDQLAVAAERMGAMQGHYLLQEATGRGIRYPWFSEGYEREYARRVSPLVEEGIRNAAGLENPVMRPFLTTDKDGLTLLKRNQLVWNDRNRFLDLLDRNPARTVAHRYFWYGNVAADAGRTLVLDTASIGIGVAGADLAKLVIEVCARDKATPVQAHNINRVLTAGYLSGMSRAGVDVYPGSDVTKLVELGATSWIGACESYRLGMDWVTLAGDDERSRVIMERWSGDDAAAEFQRYAQRTERLCHAASRATQLETELGPVLKAGLSFEQIASEELLRAGGGCSLAGPFVSSNVAALSGAQMATL